MYKMTENGYITSIGTATVQGYEISAEEYYRIKNVIDNKPTPPEGYNYRLKEDLTWEMYEEPPEPPEPVDPELEELAEVVNDAYEMADELIGE